MADMKISLTMAQADAARQISNMTHVTPGHREFCARLAQRHTRVDLSELSMLLQLIRDYEPIYSYHATPERAVG